MDFRSLSRKELQALCKKNKIPANVTNIAMADALKALDKVEGLDESDSPQSPERSEHLSVDIPRTTSRTSARRRQINAGSETSQSMICTRRSTRRTVAEGTAADQTNNKTETPAVPTTSRRVTAGVSARQKIVSQVIENEEDENSVVETPALRTCKNLALGKSEGQRVYSTRRSVRLLEKSMLDLSLHEEIADLEVKKDVSGSDLLKASHESPEQSGDSENFSCQNLDQSVEEERDMTIGNEIPRDDKSHDNGVQICNVNLEVVFDGCDDLGGLSGLDAGHDDNDKSADKLDLLQNENSEKSEGMSFGSSNGNAFARPDLLISESSETQNAAFKSDISNDLNASHDPFVVETSHKSPAVAMEMKHTSIVEVPDEVSAEVNDHPNTAEFSPSHEMSTYLSIDEFVTPTSLSPKLSKSMGESSEIMTEYKQHGCCDLHLMLTTKVDSDSNQLDKLEENEKLFMDKPIAEIVQKQALLLQGQVIHEKLGSKNESEEHKLIFEHQENIKVSDNLVTKPCAIDELPEHVEVLIECDIIEPEILNVLDSDTTHVSLNHESLFCPMVSDKSENLVNVNEFPAEEFAMPDRECTSIIVKIPSSLDEMNPCQAFISGGKLTDEIVFSPFVSDTLEGLPRPTVLTPKKLLAKKETTIQIISHGLDINKENIENSSWKSEPNKDKVKKKVTDEKIQLKDLSLRQLTKMVKELQICNQNNEEKNVKKDLTSRVALQDTSREFYPCC